MFVRMRAQIYAAHFSRSHSGWGLTYPLADILTIALGFTLNAWIFLGILAAYSAFICQRHSRHHATAHH